MQTPQEAANKDPYVALETQAIEAGWLWIEGMEASYKDSYGKLVYGRVVQVNDEQTQWFTDRDIDMGCKSHWTPIPTDAKPNLRDPATLGCLLAVLGRVVNVHGLIGELADRNAGKLPIEWLCPPSETADILTCHTCWRRAAAEQFADLTSAGWGIGANRHWHCPGCKDAK